MPTFRCENITRIYGKANTPTELSRSAKTLPQDPSGRSFVIPDKSRELFPDFGGLSPPPDTFQNDLFIVIYHYLTYFFLCEPSRS